METTFFIPESNRNDFNKAVRKAQKHIDIKVECGKPYDKVFRHTILVEKQSGITRMSHKIFDVKIMLPEFNKWELIAEYKEGSLYISNHREKLVFSNKNHGADYHKCDCCGHTIRKEMFVIRNKETNEELQVGSECAKAYGIEGLKWVSKFYAELYAIYDFRGCSDENDGESGVWKGGKDPYEFQSVEVNNVIKAAKLLYDETNGVWTGGSYNGGIYTPSRSKGILKGYVTGGKGECTETYIEELKSYISQELKDSYNEFEEEMYNNITNYYMSLDNVHYIFFSIKKYEKYLLTKKLGSYKEGDYLHVVGDIISDKVEEGFYGNYHIITIKAKNGKVFIRKGVVPNVDGKIDIYAFVDNVWDSDTYLGRVTKNPKKGYEPIEVI